MFTLITMIVFIVTEKHTDVIFCSGDAGLVTHYKIMGDFSNERLTAMAFNWLAESAHGLDMGSAELKYVYPCN